MTYGKIGVIFALISLLAGCRFSTSPKVICEENIGGKWGAVKSECILPSCAKTKTCGTWAYPAQYCEKISLGQSKDNLRFWLGEPDIETPNNWKWESHKGDSGDILAEFQNDKLVKFTCPK